MAPIKILKIFTSQKNPLVSCNGDSISACTTLPSHFAFCNFLYETFPNLLVIPTRHFYNSSISISDFHLYKARFNISIICRYTPLGRKRRKCCWEYFFWVFQSFRYSKNMLLRSIVFEFSDTQIICFQVLKFSKRLASPFCKVSALLILRATIEWRNIWVKFQLQDPSSKP